jgi:hypothetical protein
MLVVMVSMTLMTLMTLMTRVAGVYPMHHMPMLGGGGRPGCRAGEMAWWMGYLRVFRIPRLYRRLRRVGPQTMLPMLVEARRLAVLAIMVTVAGMILTAGMMIGHYSSSRAGGLNEAPKERPGSRTPRRAFASASKNPRAGSFRYCEVTVEPQVCLHKGDGVVHCLTRPLNL